VDSPGVALSECVCSVLDELINLTPSIAALCGCPLNIGVFKNETRLFAISREAALELVGDITGYRRTILSPSFQRRLGLDLRDNSVLVLARCRGGTGLIKSQCVTITSAQAEAPCLRDLMPHTLGSPTIVA
jgi:hypothetical protein